MGMKTKNKTLKKEESWDDRQNRISGWDRDAIRDAVIVVIGAGAIANEVIKNLALLGFGHITVTDFDTVEITNLTRTLLFNKADIGKKKAVIAAKRFLEMNLEPTATADCFDGDVVYELGDGVIRRADVVLGCLDNLETRFAVNRACMRYGIPYIDAAIGALDWNLRVTKGHEYGCLECFAGDALGKSRFRKSCNTTMRNTEEAGKAATVQTVSSMVAAYQVTEALKFICNMDPKPGMEYTFFGELNQFYTSPLNIDQNCICHLLGMRESVEETPLSFRNTLREFLSYTSEKGYDTLMMDVDKHRQYVMNAPCPGCNKTLPINKPFYQYYSNDYYCDECRKNGVGNNYSPTESDLDALYSFSLESTPDYVLDKTLGEVGIPAFHVAEVQNSQTGEAAYFELTEDLADVIPEYNKKKNT